MAIFTNKAKDGSFTINFFIDGETFPNIKVTSGLAVTMRDDCLHFKDRSLMSKSEITLPYSKIVDAREMVETETTVKDKSVIGRAIVGGVVLGPVGAIVGGIDGTGKKKKTTSKRFYVISYKSDDGVVKYVPLEIVGATYGLKKFDALLHEKAGIALDIEEPVEASLAL